MNAPVFFESAINEFRHVSSIPEYTVDIVRQKVISFTTQRNYICSPGRVAFRALACIDTMANYGVFEFEVFSGNDGEILVSAMNGELCFDVTVEINDTFTLSIEQHDEQVLFDDKLTAEQLESHIRGAMQQKWISSVGFGPPTGVYPGTVGLVSRSETHRRVAVPA